MGSRDVIGHVTIRLPWVDFLSVVHIVTMRLFCTVREIYRLKYWTHGRGHGKKPTKGKKKRKGEGQEKEKESKREKEKKGKGEKQ